MKKLFLIVFLAFLLSHSIHAQGLTHINIALSNSGGFVHSVPSPIVTVCAANNSQIPCAPALGGTLFSDILMSKPINNPFNGDINGNLYFVAPPGNYTVTITGLGLTGYSYQLALGTNGNNLTGPGAITGVFSGNWSTTGTVTHSGTDIFSGTTTFSTTPAFTNTNPFTVSNPTVIPNLNASLLNGATFAIPGPIGSTTPSTGAFTTISATGQITSTLVTGTAPFAITSTTLVPNLNVGLVNGVAYPATAPAHSVPVITTVNATATYKVVPNCAGALNYTQSTDVFGCNSSGIATPIIQTASVAGCTTAAPPASVCGNTVTWPTPFADASYVAFCSGVSTYTVPQTGGTFGVAGIADVRSYLAASVQAVTTNLNEGNIAANFTTINCVGIHP